MAWTNIENGESMASVRTKLNELGSSGGGTYQVDLLLVGGGGAGGGVGGPLTSYSGSCNSCGGGGGGGAVVYEKGKLVKGGVLYNVEVGKGGEIDNSYIDNGFNGGTSKFGYVFAPGGGGGKGYCGDIRCLERINGHATRGGAYQWAGCNWCGGEAGYNDKYGFNRAIRSSIDGDSARSKAFLCDTAGNVGQTLFIGQRKMNVGRGGSGCTKGGTPTTTSGYGGGGSGGWHCCNNAYCYTLPGKGGDGVVIVNYNNDDGFYAEGGKKEIEEDGNIYHTFNGNGTFIIKKPERLINAIVVGGGGGGIYTCCKTGAGGGGGEVIKTQKDLYLNSSISITIGKGGKGCYTSSSGSCVCAGDGGNTTIGDVVVNGGKGAFIIDGLRTYGGASGNGNLGYPSGNESVYGGAGGGAGGPAPQFSQYNTSGEFIVGCDKFGYGYGGNGAGCCSASCGTICQCLQAGSGGSGVNYQNGRDGLVKIWYKIGDGINTSSGGNNCCAEDGCCFHEFTSDGTFTIVS